MYSRMSSREMSDRRSSGVSSRSSSSRERGASVEQRQVEQQGASDEGADDENEEVEEQVPEARRERVDAAQREQADEEQREHEHEDGQLAPAARTCTLPVAAGGGLRGPEIEHGGLSARNFIRRQRCAGLGCVAHRASGGTLGCLASSPLRSKAAKDG